MRTRRTRGGKDTAENRSNWEKYWRRTHPNYSPTMNYPGRYNKTFKSRQPVAYQELKTPNTYIIQRHGFSCANLAKVKGNTFHARVADPSLTAYGIYSLLREQKMPEGFEGTVFGSSLVRTWQTAMLEYGRYGSLTIVVSPYIKEKHGWIGDLSNMPLPFEQQMSKMVEFMQFLKGIDSPIAREIVQHKHYIQYDGTNYPLGPYEVPLKISTKIPKQSAQELFQKLRTQEITPQDPEYEYASQGDYVEGLKERNFLTSPVSTAPPLKMNALIPDVTVKEPSFREYYGAEGFVCFDKWVRDHFPAMKLVFVVSHSKWMQTLIKQYSGEVDSPIFDENAWKLKITPLKYKTGANFEFVITPGVPKPSRESTFMMNREAEPTCREPQARPLPTDYAQQFAQESETTQEEPLREEDLTNVDTQEIVESHERPEMPERPSEMPERQERPERPRSESQSSDSRSTLNTEATPVVSNMKTVPVTNQKTTLITRSYTELVHMLCDRTLSTGLNALMASNTDFKTKIMQYIHSNPYVMVSDPTDKSYFKRKVPLYLFENHYLAFVLLCKPYMYEFIDGLEEKESTFTQSILAFFNLSVSIPVIVAFLKDLQQIIEEDQEVYHLVLSRCIQNANKHYAFKADRFILSHTLLDLFIYELDTFRVTAETIDFMYTCIIDLVRYGARCSEVHYSQDAPLSLFEMVTGKEFPSKDIVPFKMPIVELEFLPNEYEIVEEWRRAKRGIDPNGVLSTYQKRHEEIKRKLLIEERNVQIAYHKAKYDAAQLSSIQDSFFTKNKSLFDQLAQIKIEYRTAKSTIDPKNNWLKARTKMQSDYDKSIYIYLNQRLLECLDPSIKKMHDVIMKRIIQSEYKEPVVSMGGSRGTSWKKSSLRQFSVKAGRYRASLYKGKRRTRANRS